MCVITVCKQVVTLKFLLRSCGRKEFDFMNNLPELTGDQAICIKCYQYQNHDFYIIFHLRVVKAKQI